MQNTFKLNSKEVPKERWCWEAHYQDGTILKQFDENSGTFHQFKEIDQSNLKLFRMIRDDGSMFHDLAFNPKDMKLIHYYINTSLRDGKYKFKSYCFGFEKNIHGKSHKFLATILPSDNLTFSDGSFNLVIDINE